MKKILILIMFDFLFLNLVSMHKLNIEGEPPYIYDPIFSQLDPKFKITFLDSLEISNSLREVFHKLEHVVFCKDYFIDRALKSYLSFFKDKNVNIIDELTDLIRVENNDTLISQIIVNLALLKVNINRLKNGKNNLILIQAIYDQDTNLLKKLLSFKEVDVNVREKYRYSALMIAICCYNRTCPEVIEILLSNKDINIDYKVNGNSALSLALYYGYIDIAKLLIAQGANINVQDTNGNTPLMLAVKSNNIDLVKLLLEKNADISLKDNEEYDALDWAEYLGFSSIIELISSYY